MARPSVCSMSIVLKRKGDLTSASLQLKDEYDVFDDYSKCQMQFGGEKKIKRRTKGKENIRDGAVNCVSSAERVMASLV